MKNLKLVFIITLVFLVVGNCLYAGQMKKTAQTVMKWMAIPVGARAISMGSANYSHFGSAGDLYWNPAGTAFIKSPQLFLSHLPWIADVNMEAAAFAMPLGGFGVVSASARVVDYGELMGAQFVDNPAEIFQLTGPFSPSSFQVGLGFSQRVTDRFSYGLHLSYAEENLGSVYITEFSASKADARIEGTGMSAFNLDFGAIYFTGFKDLRVCMTLKNFSKEQGYADVQHPTPMDIRMSMAMDFIPLFADILGFNHAGGLSQQLNVSVDASHPRDYTERIHLGAEYVFHDMVALRAGYKFNYDEEGLVYGAGIKYQVAGKTVAIDYAYKPFGIFDAVNAFTFTLAL